MMRRDRSFRFSCSGLAALAALTLVSAAASAQGGGSVIRDEPTAVQPATEQIKPAVHGKFYSILEAVCWYIPNRIVDLTDIPRLYITAGDGMGASVRATKLVEASWFQDDAHCLGWQPRTVPYFSENLNERYFGLLFAQQGRKERDPTEVGLSFHFITVGANAALSISEAADFVLGFVGIDLRGDDHGPVLGVDLTKKEEAPANADATKDNGSSAPAPPATPVIPAPSSAAPSSAAPAQQPVDVPSAASAAIEPGAPIQRPAGATGQ